MQPTDPCLLDSGEEMLRSQGSPTQQKGQQVRTAGQASVISELSLVSKDWFLSGTGCFLGVELRPLKPCLCSELSAKLLTGSQASQTRREHRELGTGGMGGLWFTPVSAVQSTRMGLEEEEGALTRD